MKRLLALVLALVMLFSLAACGAQGDGGAAGSSDKKLVVWLEKLFNDRPGDKMAERMMAWGDANGVEVEVSFVGAVDFANKLNAAIEGGGMPDIFIDYSGRLMNYYPEMIAADVTDLYEELDEAVGFSDACANSCYFEGKARIIPMYASGTIMHCRADKLKAAGYKFGEDGKLSPETPINVEYLTNNGTGHIAVAESMQQDFAVLGIQMTIQSVDWNVFLEERKAGNFDFCREGWLADFNDPINMLEMWITDSGNNDCQFGRVDK